jgi:hypothetical protein
VIYLAGYPFVVDTAWTDAVVVIVDPTYVPDAALQSTLADVTGEIARADAAVTVSLSGGVYRVDFDAVPSIDISAAPAVGGWVLASDGASDAARVLVRWGAYDGVTPPDPFEVAAPDGAAKAGPA